MGWAWFSRLSSRRPAAQPRSVRPRSSSLALTSSRLFCPKLVMLSRSSSFLVSSSPTVLTWARLRQLFGRSDRSRSSIGRSRSGELTARRRSRRARGPWARRTSWRRGRRASAASRRPRRGRRRGDRTVGLDLDDEAVVVGRLLDAGRLDLERHPADRAEDRVDRDDADRAVLVFAVARQVAAALLDGEVDRQAALGVERGDVQVRAEDLDVGRALDVAGGDLARRRGRRGAA